MTVKRVIRVAVGENMFDDEDAFVAVPAFWIGVHHTAVADAVHRFAKAGAFTRCAPIFPGVIFAEAVAKDAKIAAAPADAEGVGRVNGKI